MTREEFAERWQHQHYPTMDLQAEVSFYYDIYQRICSVANDGSKKINEFYVIQILLYVENMGHLKLDGVYAQLYRRSEDMVGALVRTDGVVCSNSKRSEDDCG